MTPSETIKAIEVLHSVEYTLRNSGKTDEANKILKKIFELIEKILRPAPK